MKKLYKLVATYTNLSFEEMVKKLIEKRSFDGRSSMVKQAVREMYERSFKDYLEKKVKVKKVEKEEVNICELLNGTEIEENGQKVCKFSNYHYKTEYPQSIPVDDLTMDLLSVQYSPNKKACGQE